MQVAHIVHSMGGGGLEKVVSKIVNANNTKITHTIIAFNNEKKYDVNCEFKYLYGTKTSNKIIKIFRFLRLKSKLRKIQKELKFDVVVTHGFIPTMLSLSIFKRSKRIFVVHNSMNLERTSFIRKIVANWWYPKILRKVDKVVTVSKGVATEMSNLYKFDESIVKVIYNPVEFPQIYNKEQKNDVLHLLIVARLIHEKLHFVLLGAVKKMILEGFKIRLTICGSGFLEGEVRDFIDKESLSNNVTLLGFQKNIIDFYDESDIFLFASKSEGLGNVLLEAASRGLVLVSTDTLYGPREIIDDSSDYSELINTYRVCDNGVLVKRFATDNSEELVEAFCEALKFIYNDAELRRKLSVNAVLRSENFKLERFESEWNLLLEEVFEC